MLPTFKRFELAHQKILMPIRMKDNPILNM